MLLRLVGIVAVAVLVLGAATLRGQAQDAVGDWRAALESAVCPGDYGQAASYDLDTIIAERIGLEDINAGFDKLREGHSARSIVVFD